MRYKTVITAAVAVVLATPAAFAQEDMGDVVSPYVPISYGETLSNYLTVADDSLQDGSYYKMFVFAGEQGDSVTVSINSLDFNAHILFADSMEALLADDGDGGGTCNAHLTRVLDNSGVYVVFATTFTPHEMGEFQISLNKGILTPEDTSPCAGFFDREGTLSAGDSAMGTLGPPDPKLGPSYVQVWNIDVGVDQTVTVDLQSIIFDARLTLYRGFATPVDANDDGGGACNARLVLTGDGHPHIVVLTSGKPEETGPYNLRVTEGALPIVQESQCEG